MALSFALSIVISLTLRWIRCRGPSPPTTVATSTNLSANVDKNRIGMCGLFNVEPRSLR